MNPNPDQIDSRFIGRQVKLPGMRIAACASKALPAVHVQEWFIGKINQLVKLRPLRCLYLHNEQSEIPWFGPR